MKYQLSSAVKDYVDAKLIIISAFQKDKNILSNAHWPKDFKESFIKLESSKNFTGKSGSQFIFPLENGHCVLAVGLGDKTKYSLEDLRNTFAKIYNSNKGDFSEISIQLEAFKKKNLEDTTNAIIEGFELAAYKFDLYLSKKQNPVLETIILSSKENKAKLKNVQKTIDETCILTEAINFGRDLVNEPPNVLHSEEYAKRIVNDVKNIKGVKAKVLGKTELKKLKMGLFLSVNAGSAFAPQLVHLTYTPKKVTKKTKHIAFVGKGLTFDTGGYSLKPAGSMVNMKFDMAGSATVYAAFKAAASLGLDVKISCFLGMTDNAVNEKATVPDSIVTGMNGTTVEILNTDAEGRLVLADCLTYASEQNPDAIIDAATLTGAVLVSLGHEVCGVMGNDQKLVDKLLKSAKDTDEYMWQLPMIKEYSDDLKSPIADLKNIGGSRFGGSSKAACFLSNFVAKGISWAHLDIAGIGDAQGHKSYCPKKGASGLVVRSLVDYLRNV